MPSRISFHLRDFTRLSFACVILGLSSLTAQLSPYDQRLRDNIEIISDAREYAFTLNSVGDHNYAVNNAREIIEVDRLLVAIAEAQAALDDGVEGEFEERARERYAYTTQFFMERHEQLRSNIDSLIENLGAEGYRGKDAQLRLRSLIEQNAFVLPIMLFDGETPYHEMYRETAKAYREMGGNRPGVNPFRLELPEVNVDALGSSTPQTPAMRRAALEAEARGEASSPVEVAAGVTPEELRAMAIAAAEAEHIEALKAAGLELDEAGNAVQAHGTGFLGWIFRLILLLVLGTIALWLFRSKLPSSVAAPFEDYGGKLFAAVTGLKKQGLAAKSANQKESD